jgi:hypothetical protein
MIRAVNRGLLRLHPAEFEERFSEEMLWIFDLKRSEETGIALLLDGLISLCRQWLFYTPVRTFLISVLVHEFFALCSAICLWNTSRHG